MYVLLSQLDGPQISSHFVANSVVQPGDLEVPHRNISVFGLPKSLLQRHDHGTYPNLWIFFRLYKAHII